ncbi:NADPH:quinone oxidoreductase family protein [Alcaligenaceae bacterium]|nr:NADPH:quinone oxidoreductase family protein [Alcaligenaceae bacterium]
MKAFVCEKWMHYSELALQEVAPPTPSAGQVSIAVHFAAVSFGQTLIVAGKYQRKPPLPFVPGTEISGVVLEVGPDVTEFAPGDRVAAILDWGGYAEVAVATVATTWHVPDGVSLAVAASVPLTYGTAYAALHWRGRIKAGETLLVYGAAGGVGLPAVQLGRLANANVIAVAGSDDRVKVAMGYGAHSGIVHSEGQLSQQVRDLNGGHNVELVFDPVGGALFDEALRCVKPEGRVLIVGFASGEIPKIPANILLVKNIEAIGFNFGFYVGWGLTDEREYYKQRLRIMMETIFAHIAAGELQSISSKPYPMVRLTEAFDAVVERQSIGRILIQIAGDMGTSA